MSARDQQDPIEALRAADPVRPSDLSRTDDAAFVVMREGIVMTGTARPRPGGRRRRRRTLTAGALALALVGGGTAYATYETWYAGGAGDGLTCMTTWDDPLDGDSGTSTGGPALTTDPVADCQRYQELTGGEPITDPVAFTYNGQTFVAPRGEVPADLVGVAVQAPAAPDAEARMRLENSLEDAVDGGRSTCFDLEEGLAFAEAEIARLGLSGISVEEQDLPEVNVGEGRCGWFIPPHSGRDVVLFSPGRYDDPLDPPEIAVTLRERVAERCLGVEQAEAEVTKALGTQHHWPTSPTRDDSLECTKIDLVLGGSQQIFLRGPATVRR